MGKDVNVPMSEEQVQMAMEGSSARLYAYNKIPYSLVNQELQGKDVRGIQQEFGEICRYYKAYKSGVPFAPEGSNGDYVPADLKFKMVYTLINKEARFLFAESPDTIVESTGDRDSASDELKEQIDLLNRLITKVRESNNFDDSLLKAAKDCFIGKRVAGLVNFNPDDGVTITFLTATQFLYERKVGNPNELSKFVAFIVTEEARQNTARRIFKKKYELEGDSVYLEEALYDGAGMLIEEVTARTKLDIDFIPAVVFINDGLTADVDGESEIFALEGFEQWYSKLSNADADSERKGMNPIKYAVDMESNSTKNLSTSAGSFWDLQTDQNLDDAHTQVGILESNMNYSNALKTTLDRIKTTAYESVDVPNITLESLQGAITSGKALKAIYWPLIVRCKEKMKMWGPKLKQMIEMIIEGAKVYPDCITNYISEPLVPVDYEVKIEQNLPLPEDEAEEKNLDMAEVSEMLMSKKSYMKKWRGLTDAEVDEELKQMAVERQILEDSAFNQNNNADDSLPYPQSIEDGLQGASALNDV